MYILFHFVVDIYPSNRCPRTICACKVRRKSSVNPIGTVNHTSKLYQYDSLFDFLMRARG